MTAIVNNYNKGMAKIIEALIPANPLPQPPVNERPRIPVNSGDSIILDANGQLVTANTQLNRQRVAIALPQTPIRTPRAIRRTGDGGGNRRPQDPMLLDLNRRSSGVELDLGRRSGNIDLDIPPDPPGYLNVSDDPFGPR